MFEEHCYLKKGICMWGSIILHCRIGQDAYLVINENSLVIYQSSLV